MEKAVDSFVTTRQAAEMLGVALSTVQLWTNKGLLQAWITDGGHRRIAASSIQNMLDQRDCSLNKDNVPASNQLTVVVVEDDPAQRKIYAQQFAMRALPINLVMAKDGFEGLIQIGRHKPDLLICDLNLPNMDGFEMIRAIQEMEEMKHCMIVAVTNYDYQEINEKGGLPKGMQIYSKPIPFNILVDIIRDTAREK